MISLLRLSLVLLSFLPILLQAQALELSYDIKQSSSLAPDTLQIFLQSKSNSTVGIRAVSFSLAFDGGKHNLLGYDSEFRQSWTPTFELARIDSVNLNYRGRNYRHRWNYGIGDAIINASSLIVVPEDTIQPLKVLELYFQNLSSGMAYVENQAENPVNQIGDESFRQISYNVVALPGAFPVEWAFFNAQPLSNGETVLSWGTASEVNNAWFEVERSSQKDFSSYLNLGKVNGKGNSNTETRYQFTDSDFGSGRYYYRIRQVDYDGGFSFSNIISTELGKGIFAISAGPSPAKDILTIRLEGISQSGFRLEIMDAKGIVLKSLETLAPEGKSTDIVERIDELAAGTYLIRATLLDGSLEQRSARILVLR